MQIYTIIIIRILQLYSNFLEGLKPLLSNIITPSENHHNHFASPIMVCNWPSASPIRTCKHSPQRTGIRCTLVNKED